MPKKAIGLNKFALDTPCLVIDKDALEYNLQYMQNHAVANKINVRPHCKTHKCSTLAKLQMKYGATGVCAAKIAEAAVLINNGLTGVLITSPLVTQQKINAFIACAKIAPDTMVVVDYADNIADLNRVGESIGQVINVLVDLDPGIGRTGVKPENALHLGLMIHHCKWLNLVGIQCYAGNLQHISSYEQRKKASLAAMQTASAVIIKFRENGLSCPILTGSGTGTFDIDPNAIATTEIQPGSYAVMDVEYSIIGSTNNPSAFTTFRHAMTLLTTVISCNRREHVTVDAGTKSIYIDAVNKPKIISHTDLEYDWGGFGDEHGKITSSNHKNLPKNGVVLELIVPHCDPTINLYDRFYITQNDIVIDVWPIDMRGKSQ